MKQLLNKITFLLLLSLVAVSSQAGDKVITGVPAANFAGITAVENQGFYLLYLSESGEDNLVYYILEIMDPKMETKSKQVLELPASVQFIGNVKDGNNTTLVFQDMLTRTYNLITLDFSNGTIKKNDFLRLPEDKSLSRAGNLQLRAATGEGFFTLQPMVKRVKYMKGKKELYDEFYGYQVIRIDDKHQVKWEYSYFPDKHSQEAQIIASEPGDDCFVIAQSVTGRDEKSSRYDRFENMITSIDDKTGKVKFTFAMQDGTDGGYPGYIKVDKDGSVVVGGNYFVGAKYDAVASDGLFILRLEKDGTKKYYTKTPWANIESKLKMTNKSDFLVSGKSKVLIQDIIKGSDGAFHILGELFKISSANTAGGFILGTNDGSKAFSVQDFVVFTFKEGAMEDVYRIEKKEMNVLLPEGMSGQRGLSLSYMLRSYNIFSYMKTIMVDGKPTIIFTNTENDKKYIYQTPVAYSDKRVYLKAESFYPAPVIKMEELSKLERMSMQMTTKLDAVGKGLQTFTTGTDMTFSYFRDPYNSFDMAKPGEVLVYNYDPIKHELNLKTYQLK